MAFAAHSGVIHWNELPITFALAGELAALFSKTSISLARACDFDGADEANQAMRDLAAAYQAALDQRGVAANATLIRAMAA